MRLDEIHAIQVSEATDGVRQILDIREYFTCGRCWELSEAMNEILDQSRIIEIRVSNGAWNMLVHAGVEVDGNVIDIEGRHRRADWVASWTSSWDAPAISYRRGRGALLGFETKRTMKIARHVAGLLVDAVAADLGTQDTKKAA
jgi:hypothetical protein